MKECCKQRMTIIIIAVLLLIVAVKQGFIFSGAVIESGTIVYSQNFDSAVTGTLIEHIDTGLVPQADSWWCSGSVGCTNYISPPVTQFGAGWHPLPWNAPSAGMFVSDVSIGSGKSLIGYSYAYYEYSNKIFPRYYTDWEYDIDFKYDPQVVNDDQMLLFGTYMGITHWGPSVYIGPTTIRDTDAGINYPYDRSTTHTLSLIAHRNSTYRMYLDGVEFSRGIIPQLGSGIDRINFGVRGRDSGNPRIGYFDNLVFSELAEQKPGDGIVNGFEVCDPALPATSSCPSPLVGEMSCSADGMSWNNSTCLVAGAGSSASHGGGGTSHPLPIINVTQNETAQPVVEEKPEVNWPLVIVIGLGLIMILLELKKRRK